MKRILVTFVVMVCALVATAADPAMEFDVPDGFRVDTISKSRYVVEKDSAYAVIHFISIPNIDTRKAKKAHDSIFVDVSAYELLEADIDGEADVINKYFNPLKKKYITIYRHVHTDGITQIFAVNDTDEFAWADTIADTYQHGLRWYEIIFYGIILIIVFMVPIFIWGYFIVNAMAAFNKNWFRFVVFALPAIAPVLILGIWFGEWLWPSVLLVGVGWIGSLARKGYIIIPI